MLEEGVRKVIGRNISMVRQRCGMTQAELAELAGAAVEDVVHGENGDVEISVELLMGICDATGTTADEILAGAYDGDDAGEGTSCEENEISIKNIRPEDRALMEHIYYFLSNKKPAR